MIYKDIADSMIQQLENKEGNNMYTTNLGSEQVVLSCFRTRHHSFGAENKQQQLNVINAVVCTTSVAVSSSSMVVVFVFIFIFEMWSETGRASQPFKRS